jgi:hypothetical protein
MHSPAVALARSIRTQQRCRPYLETAFFPLRVGCTFSKIKFLNFLPISRLNLLLLKE